MNLDRLENETLPAFFRHSRFQSLVRQLNFYNFRKINKERTVWIYFHPLFHRDHPESLHLLRRRTCPGVDGRRTRHELASFLNGESTFSLDADVGSDEDSMLSDERPRKRRKSSGTKQGHYRKPLTSQQQPPAVGKIADALASTSANETHAISHLAQFQNRRLSSTVYDTPLTISESDSHKRESPVLLSEVDSVSGSRSSSTMMNSRSTLLSKLSRKLEEHIKRANTFAASASVNQFSRRGGRKRMVGVVTPPQAFHSDTLKYNALTYDDDDDEYYDGDDAEGIENTSLEIFGGFDDNHVSSSNHDKRIRSSPNDQLDSVSVNSSECPSQTGANDSITSLSYMDRLIMEMEIKKKIHSWVYGGAYSSITERSVISSAVHVCFETTPTDPHLRGKALDYMKINDVLAQEFQRYKGALLGTEISPTMFHEKQCLSQCLFGGDAESLNTTRIFTMFIVNHLQNFIRDPNIRKAVNLSQSESRLFQSKVKIWFEGVLSSF